MKIKAAIIISGLFLLGVCAYYNLCITFNFLAGALWSLINLYFIRQLVYGLLLEKPKKIFKIMAFALLKFPVLYSAGFLLLYYEGEFAWALLAGFSVTLLLSMQRRFWKVFKPFEKKAMRT